MIPDRTKEPEHVFKLLKGVFGKPVDVWWRRYNALKPERKARMLRRLNALAMSVLDLKVGGDGIFLPPPTPEVIEGGDYTLGSVAYPKAPPAQFTIPKAELLQHMFVLGRSGTGKTTFFLNILQQLLADSIPFWILDWKRNYRVLLKHPRGKDMIVLTVGSDLAPLRLNMLRPPAGVDVYEWVEALTDTIGSGYLLLQGAKNVLKAGMLDAIRRLGPAATLRDALPYIQTEFARAKARKAGWLESTDRAIDELTKGPFGDALNAQDGMTIEALLPQCVDFELEGLGDDQRKTFSVFLLQANLMIRKRQTLPREVLHQVLLFDEAHNVFVKEKLGDPPSVQSRLAREIREFGIALLAGTQQTDISNSIMANSGTSIVFQVRSPWDAKIASDLLGVEQKSIGEIPKGHGIARLPDRHLQAFLFRFDPQPIKNIIVPDNDVMARHHAWRGTNTADSRQDSGKVPEAGQREITLLLDIAAYPISTVTQRYQRLGWNPNTGNIAQKRLEEKGLVEFLWIEDGRTRLKILSPTDSGSEVVRANGGIVRPTGPAGAEHELWRSRLRDRITQHNYDVIEEYKVNERQRVDLCATRADRRIFIEVETGKSDVQENIRKCKGQPLILFFTSKAALNAARPHIPHDVIVLTPETINSIHGLIR
jgi:DNA-binding PadR family transcriptional regulator